MCILYVLIMYLNYNYGLSCTYYNLYNGENVVGPDFRHVLYFIIHCKRFKINVDFRGESVRWSKTPPLAYSLYAFITVDNIACLDCPVVLNIYGACAPAPR